MKDAATRCVLRTADVLKCVYSGGSAQTPLGSLRVPLPKSRRCFSGREGEMEKVSGGKRTEREERKDRKRETWGRGVEFREIGVGE